MKNRNALIVIAKYPERESVKTRLKGSLPDDERLRLYIHFLDHTMEKLASIPGADTFIAFAPAEMEGYFRRFKAGLIPLHEGDLGERMFEAFSQVFSSGYKRASLVGVDIPDLTARIILDSFDVLNDNDLVYGPATDGGYYLVGMKSPVEEVFRDVPWSSDRTLQKSLDRANKCGFRVGFTRMLSDIDTFEDLRRSGLLK